MTHVTRINKPGLIHPIEPQSVVLLDPITGDPASAPLTNSQLRASAVPVSSTALSSLDAKLPNQVIAGMMPVDVLASLGVARQLAAGAVSANTALTATCRRISIRCRNADVRFAIGTGVQTANASTSHFIAQDERLDFDVPANAQIAVIRAGSVDGIIELSELV